MSLPERPAYCWVLAACLLLAGCGASTPRQDSAQGGASNDFRTQTRHDVTVSTTLLTDGQARQVYGVDLADVGLQAIWLRMENRSDHSHWLLVAALDANYFAPGEAAALFTPGLMGEDETRLVQRFNDLAMPLKSPPGAITEGYVLAPRHEGGRYLAVTLAGEKHSLHFDFAVTLPDGTFDFESLEPEQIYAGQVRPDLDLDALQARLRGLPCCTTDKKAQGQGDPVNLVFLGNLGDVLAGLSRAGWSFTHKINLDTVRRLIGAGISGGAYPVAPVSPLYLFDRPQDLALQRARNTILQRNHIRLWLAPFRHQERSVWVGQVSRDVSIKPTLRSPNFVTHVIDPNVDEARENLLQSLMLAGVLQRFAFAAGAPVGDLDEPRKNLTGDPYISDGLRLVAQVSGRSTTALGDIEFLDWQDSPDPLLAPRARRCRAVAGDDCTFLPPGVTPPSGNGGQRDVATGGQNP
ncbi:LssY C-terminal domain-containing protein [Parahaliea mediterranea]|uniref:LssY C-terminal domain-containing protein n=1 Tax=Parahaliea mediterranea TaxID=651086 RepID=A0A939DH27_9GAMM|nr:LssY C-terminal domain-containing protein [Parahaliea mediterranea]MBN7798066.1 LssY C-terminal domain-containing protein [Parahaliea mediterranea]